MKRQATAAFVTFVVTFALVPLIRHLCHRRQIFDEPGVLKIHVRPIPRLGGAAIFPGVLAGIFVSAAHSFVLHWQFVAAMSVIWVAGLVDDFRSLAPASRLGAQVLAAVLLWQGGWYISRAAAAPMQIVLLCLFVILFVNSFNFLDGSDGLAAGVSCVIALSYLALPGTALTSLGFSTALCTAAACVAFLAFNRCPASIFLGDSGATLLAFLVAFAGLDAANRSGAPKYSIALAFAIAALPIFDAVRVVIKRIARGVSPLSGDRNHFYDALLAKGWKPQRVAVVSWAMVAFCGATVAYIVRMRARVAWSLVAFVIVAAWIDLVAVSRGKRIAADREAVATGSDGSVFVSRSKGSESIRQEGRKF